MINFYTYRKTQSRTLNPSHFFDDFDGLSLFDVLNLTNSPYPLAYIHETLLAVKLA